MVTAASSAISPALLASCGPGNSAPGRQPAPQPCIQRSLPVQSGRYPALITVDGLQILMAGVPPHLLG